MTAGADRRSIALVADEDDAVLHAIALDGGSNSLRSVTPLAGAPSQVLVLADGRVVVALRDKNRIQVLEPSGDPRNTPFASLCEVDVAEEPVGLASTASNLLVTSGWGKALTIFDLKSKGLTTSRVIPLARDPRSVLVDDDGKRAFVSHVVGSTLSIVDLEATKTSIRHVPLDVTRQLGMNEREKIVEKAGQGFALAKTIHDPSQSGGGGYNYNDDRIFIPMVIADPGNDRPVSTSGYGSGRPGPSELPFVGVVGVNDEKSLANAAGENINRSRECLLPRAAAFSSKRQTLLVACMGIDTLVELESSGSSATTKNLLRNEKSRWKVGVGPTGIALDVSDTRAVVWSQFDHALTVIPLKTTPTAATPPSSPLRPAAKPSPPPPPPPTPLPMAMTLEVARRVQVDADLARGRVLFHKTDDRRVSSDGRACASCHPDGREDSLTWSTPFGPRQTIMLAGRTASTAPYSWSGTNATIEEHVTGTFTRLGGTGIVQGEGDLRALLTYVASLKTPVHAAKDAQREERRVDVARGRTLFFDAKQACSTCHVGGTGTDGKRHQVGNGSNGNGAASSSTSSDKQDEPMDTPSLRFVGGTAPYFHDGRFASLDEMLASSQHKMGSTQHLDANDRRALIAFLETL